MDENNARDVGKANQGDDIAKPAVRDNLIRTAVLFLKSPRVVLSSTPLQKKIDFLKEKGLTDPEIEMAIQNSGAIVNSGEVGAKNRDQVSIPMLGYPSPSLGIMQPPPPPFPPQSRLLWIRDLANTLLAIGGVGYIIYWFYKRYVKPYLFGKKEPRKKPVEAQIVELDLSVDTVKKDMKVGFERLSGDLEKLVNQRLDIVCLKSQNEILELTAQVTSLKGLLLSRKQFPAVPTVASIPSWQLPSGIPGDDEPKEDDIQSVASDNKSTNGGSDSSLEMIKE